MPNLKVFWVFLFNLLKDLYCFFEFFQANKAVSNIADAYWVIAVRLRYLLRKVYEEFIAFVVLLKF